jgi:Bacterial Ig-like domain
MQLNRPGTSVWGRRGRGRLSVTLALTVLAASAQACLGAAPALAALTGPGVSAGKNITVFHNLDFVGVYGYGPVGDPITVDVVRNGVTIGTATGPSVNTRQGPGLEINHGPKTIPQPGDCWTGTTPNIRPGDRILVTSTSTGTQDEVTVDNIRYTGPATEDPNTGDIVVSGIAQQADGTPIPASSLDAGEFRDLTGKLRITPNVVEPTPGVTAGFTMRYRAPYTVFRNRDNLSEEQQKQELLGNGHLAGFGHALPLPPESMLVDGIADRPGPAVGCEGSPAAPDPITPPPPPPPAGDTVAPSVASRSPLPGATAVAGGANVTVGFSEPVTGIDSSTFTLTGPGGPVPATVSYDAALEVATVLPSAPLAAGTAYTVALTGSVSDAAGNRLTPTSWTFTTLAPPQPTDMVAPSTTSHTPTSGAKQVNRAANVTAAFSEPVTGLSTTSMTVKTNKGITVPAAVTYNPTTRVATLDPAATLAKRTRYTATLTNGITDIAGNKLSTQSWTFTTGG